MKNKGVFILIGDLCQDVRIFGSCTRISPEAPVPILELNGYYDRTETQEGMIGNVHTTLANFIYASTPGIMSQFPTMRLCNELNKPVKTRYYDVARGQMMIRIDDTKAYDEELEHFQLQDLLGCLERANESDLEPCVIVSDYNKGFLTYQDLIDIGQTCKRWGVPSFIDTKKKIGSKFGYVEFFYSFLKINKKELDESFTEEGNAITLGPGFDNQAFITFGREGTGIVTAIKRNQPEFKMVATDVLHAIDVCGAGDVYLAALAFFWMQEPGMELEKLARICNYAAGLVCQTHRTSLDGNDCMAIIKKCQAVGI